LRLNKFLAAAIFLMVANFSHCQGIDTSNHKNIQRFASRQLVSVDYKKPFPIKSFILPGLAVAYGVTTLENNKLKKFNSELKEEIWLEGPQHNTSLDNYLQWTPAALVYGLNIAGVHGKNNLRDRTMIYLLSQVFMIVMMNPETYVRGFTKKRPIISKTVSKEISTAISGDLFISPACISVRMIHHQVICKSSVYLGYTFKTIQLITILRKFY